MSERVVITGVGIISPVGHNVETMWKNVLEGNNGADFTTIFDASTFPTQFSAEVKGFKLENFVSKADLHKDANRGSQFAVAATAEACKQAGIDTETDSPNDGIDRRRMGVYLGAGEGSLDTDSFFKTIVESYSSDDRKMDWKKWAQVALESFSPYSEMEQEPSLPVSHVAMVSGARGEIRSCLTACAASTQAIGEATNLIRKGRADIMVSGGAHSMIHVLGVTGFNRLTALSTRNDDCKTASRPFSASRDGFVIGEGSAILILESLTSAKKRGVNILAEVIGYGSTSDAFRCTDMHEDARGGKQAIESALEDANVTAKDVQYINAHGTSTKENDSIETLAIKRAFGEEAYKTPVSSTKSTMGHLIGAAGAAELITCVMAMKDKTLPPTKNLNDKDPDLDLDYIPNEPRPCDLNIAMNESFGFGGQNNVVIVRKYSE